MKQRITVERKERVQKDAVNTAVTANIKKSHMMLFDFDIADSVYGLINITSQFLKEC